MASQLEEALAQGVKDGKVPHAIVYATNKDGSFTYSHSTGYQNYGTNSDPIKDDAILMLASQSKLLTAISALKLIELGTYNITLDSDVTPHLPELGSKQILTGFSDDDKPILVDRKNPITLRNLLNHTSGHTYGMTPDVVKYEKTLGKANPAANIKATVVSRYDTPLIFEPGTSWMYSTGLDWTGLLIYRLTGLTLHEFEEKYIWTPLGLKDVTFWPSESQKSRIPQLTIRGADGKLVKMEDEHINTHSQDCFGGHGAYANLSDYLKILHSILANDSKILNPSSVETLFSPSLGEGSETALNAFMQAWHTFVPGEYNIDIPLSYSVGGLIFMEDDEGRRKKGTMSWGGLFNPFWIVDREAGVAYTFGTQVLPPGDKGCKEMSGVGERAVYEMAGVKF